MTVSTLILGLFLSGIIAYFVTKLTKTAGSVIVVTSILTVLICFLLAGDGMTANSDFGMFSFKVTPLGWFCSMLILFIYSMVALFNTYWLEYIINPAAYNMLYLFSLAGTIGVFFAHDFIVLFIFWEIAVWTSMFIISFGKSRNAAVVYFTMSILASFMMLYAIFMLYVRYNSFEFQVITTNLGHDPRLALTTFILLSLAAIVKIGIFPFHIWVPKAYGNAPDLFTPVLSGAISKLGAFLAVLVTAIVPVYDVFLEKTTIWGLSEVINLLLLLSAISIIVGTLLAIKQDDAKMLLAYSSVANAGYILIGIMMNDPVAMSGALTHLLVHGISTAAAFLAIAAVSYRTGTSKMSEMGGLIHRMPVTFTIFLIAMLSIVGLPPTLGFISKWQLFQSLASKQMFIIAGVAFFGSIGSLLYAFRPLATVFLGQLKTKHLEVKEVPIGMLLPMAILAGVSVFYGVMPYSLIEYIAKIEKAIGFKDVVRINGLSIQGSNGNLNPALITVIFVVGLTISAAIFYIAPKSRKVELMDTYTAGEFIYTPELYHYSYKFYAPLERLYENYPHTVRIYIGLTERLKDIGHLIRFLVFNSWPSQGILLIVVTIILLMWGGKP